MSFLSSFGCQTSDLHGHKATGTVSEVGRLKRPGSSLAPGRMLKSLIHEQPLRGLSACAQGFVFA